MAPNPKKNPDATVRVIDFADDAYTQLAALIAGGGGGGGGGTVTQGPAGVEEWPVTDADVAAAVALLAGAVAALEADVADGIIVSGTVDVTDRVARLLGHVAVDSSALPAGAATAAKQLPDGHNVNVGNFPASTEIANDVGNPVPVNGTVTANLGTLNGVATEATLDARTGALTESAPATDTASSGINGRLQRIAQRLTSLIALLPGSLGQKARAASFAVTLSTEDVTTLTPPAAITGYATSAAQATLETDVESTNARLGEVQASPTANTVLGRLKDLLTGIVLAAGSASIGKVVPEGSASGVGLVAFRDPAVTNTPVAVKASAGRVYWYNLFNPGTTLAYLHFYDAAAGAVVVGTTVPLLSIPLPSNANAQIGVDRHLSIPLTFATAITVAATTTPDGGSAPSTAAVVNVGTV